MTDIPENTKNEITMMNNTNSTPKQQQQHNHDDDDDIDIDDVEIDHEYYMQYALKAAMYALEIGEVPVGCVIVLLHPKYHHYPPVNNTTTTTISTTSTVLLPKNDLQHLIHQQHNDDHVIISHGSNLVNSTRDATRHAEMVAIDRLFCNSVSSDQKKLPLPLLVNNLLQKNKNKNTNKNNPNVPNRTQQEWELYLQDIWMNVPDIPNHWKNQYGWKGLLSSSSSLSNTLLTSQMNPNTILSNCYLYVTCEPCIMCAAYLANETTTTTKQQLLSTTVSSTSSSDSLSLSSSLLELDNNNKYGTSSSSGCGGGGTTGRFRKIIFGCSNTKFGGCGSILNLFPTMSSSETQQQQQQQHEHEHNQDCSIPKTKKKSNQKKNNSNNRIILGGICEQEAITLLRTFYQRENFHAPDHKRKKKEETKKIETKRIIETTLKK